MALEADVAENESGKTLNRVQNGLNLQLNSWSPCRVFALFSDSQTTPIAGISYLFCHPGGPRAVYGRGGERRRRPSERPFASPPVATRNRLARPPQRRARDVRIQLKLSRRGLSKTRNDTKITHKKCYRPQSGKL